MDIFAEARRVLPYLPARFGQAELRFVSDGQHRPALLAERLVEGGHARIDHLGGQAWVKTRAAAARGAARLLVCGGRSGANQAAVDGGLDAWVENFGPIAQLLHGACPDPDNPADGLSVDACAGRWAARHRIAATPCPADWTKLGRRAGPVRNASMADRLLTARLRGWPVAVAAFPGGRGTAHMVGQAHKRQIPVFQADVSRGEWRLVSDPPCGPDRLDAVVSVRAASALRILRGEIRSVGRELTVPVMQGERETGEREPLPIGSAIALHCRPDEWAGDDPVEQQLRAALQAGQGQVFAVAQTGPGGQFDGVWPITGVSTIARAQPWRPTGVVVEQVLDGLIAAYQRWWMVDVQTSGGRAVVGHRGLHRAGGAG